MKAMAGGKNDEMEIISFTALENLVKGTEVKPLDNSHLLCLHNKLNFEMVSIEHSIWTMDDHGMMTDLAAIVSTPIIKKFCSRICQTYISLSPVIKKISNHLSRIFIRFFHWNVSALKNP